MDISPLLIFSPVERRIYLEDRLSGHEFFSFRAHNITERPDGNPFIPGSWGPAPAGFLRISQPDFISGEFRESFYRERFASGHVQERESLVQEWGAFEEQEMGRVRFALGSPLAPAESADWAGWERELLVHGGKTFDTPTRGCIRMDDRDLEEMAFYFIIFSRIGCEIRSIHIKP